MKVDAAYGSLYLVEADVVEPFETSARYRSHSVIRNEKILLPSHKHMFPLCKVTIREISPFRLPSQWFPGRKSRPVVYICLFIRTPFFVPSLERMLSADDFALEKGRQGGMIFREALNTQVTAQVRLGHVHVLNLDVNIVYPLVRLLGADKFATGAKKRGGMVRQKLLSIASQLWSAKQTPRSTKFARAGKRTLTLENS